MQRIPWGRSADPQDFIDATVYLASAGAHREDRAFQTARVRYPTGK